MAKRSKKYEPKLALKDNVGFDDLINLSIKKQKDVPAKPVKAKAKKKK
jgi:hypothetical protein